MKGLKAIANKTKDLSGYPFRRLPLYYNISSATAYTEEGKDRFFIGYLINENTPKDIEEYIRRVLWT